MASTAVRIRLRSRSPSQAAKALSGLLTDGVETTYLDDNLPATSVKSLKGTNEKIPHVQVITEWDAENAPIVCKLDESAEKWKTRE